MTGPPKRERAAVAGPPVETCIREEAGLNSPYLKSPPAANDDAPYRIILTHLGAGRVWEACYG